jgi:putative membrane protein
MEAPHIDKGKRTVEVTVEDATVRDRLAGARSRLANERTLLAYMRTTLTLVIVGLTAMHVPHLHPVPLVHDVVYAAAGWVFLVLGGGVAALGVRRYRQMARRIREEMNGGG